MAPSSKLKLRRLCRILSQPFEPPSSYNRCRICRKTYIFINDFSIMAYAECIRQGKPYVTSSLDCLNKVSDNLASKIANNERAVEGMIDKIGILLCCIDEAQQRISWNKVVQSQNNNRVEE